MIQKIMLFTVAMFITFACATGKKTKDNSKASGKSKTTDISVGTWDYEIKNTPQGDMTGDFVIVKEGEAYTGTINSDRGSVQLQEVKVVEDNLTSNFQVDGYKVLMSGKFVGDNYTGKISVDGNDFPMTATKNK